MGKDRHGANGKNVVLKVPIGTQVYEEDGETLLADLTHVGERVTLMIGGNGGFGNIHFKSSTNQAPRHANPGQPGEERTIRLRLKLIADAGVIGLPNAGKSTFLAAVSAAKPKIADYPFTTLHPQLGVVRVDEREFVLADLPGLIEGAHEGTGLGDRFLGHTERCRVLLHLIDGTGEDVAAAYKTVRAELEAYGQGLTDKPEIVALSKADALTPEAIKQQTAKLKKACKKTPVVLSSASGQGVPRCCARCQGDRHRAHIRTGFALQKTTHRGELSFRFDSCGRGVSRFRITMRGSKRNAAVLRARLSMLDDHVRARSARSPNCPWTISPALRRATKKYLCNPHHLVDTASQRRCRAGFVVHIPIDVTAAGLTLDAPLRRIDARRPRSGRADEKRPSRSDPAAAGRKPVVHRSHQEVCDTLTQAAQTNNLPVPFFISLLFQESRFKPGVVSSAGAQGIAQFMPETAASMGLENPFDPLQAIPASARLLRNLFQQFGNLGLAAAAYNAGPRRIQDWLDKKGKLPEETQGYVKIITGRPAENWTAATAAHPGQRLPRRARKPPASMPGLGRKRSSAPRIRRVGASAAHRPVIAASHGVKAAGAASSAWRLSLKSAKKENLPQRRALRSPNILAAGHASTRPVRPNSRKSRNATHGNARLPARPDHDHPARLIDPDRARRSRYCDDRSSGFTARSTSRSRRFY